MASLTLSPLLIANELLSSSNRMINTLHYTFKSYKNLSLLESLCTDECLLSMFSARFSLESENVSIARNRYLPYIEAICSRDNLLNMTVKSIDNRDRVVNRLLKYIHKALDVLLYQTNFIEHNLRNDTEQLSPSHSIFNIVESYSNEYIDCMYSLASLCTLFIKDSVTLHELNIMFEHIQDEYKCMN